MGEPLLHRCRSCRRYTLKSVCPKCEGPAGSPHPARWSPEDRYQRYRRALLESAGASSESAGSG